MLATFAAKSQLKESAIFTANRALQSDVRFWKKRNECTFQSPQKQVITHRQERCAEASRLHKQIDQRGQCWNARAFGKLGEDLLSQNTDIAGGTDHKAAQ